MPITNFNVTSSWTIPIPEIKVPNHIEPTTKLALSILTTVGAYFLSPPSFFFMTAAGSVLINIADAYHMCNSACRSVWERVGSPTKEATPNEEKKHVSEPTVPESPSKRAKITVLDPQAGNSPHVRFSPIIHDNAMQSVSSIQKDLSSGFNEVGQEDDDDVDRSLFAAWAQDQRVGRSVARGSGIDRTHVIEIDAVGSNSPPSRTIYQDLGMHRPASKPSRLPTPPIAGSGRCTPIQGSGRSTPPIDLLEPRRPTSLYRSNFQSRK
jgi:hypothetical protein